ncbi:hypothetical protein V8E54_003687 [Elaphomyces granulatus]
MAQSFTEPSSLTIQLPYRGDRPLSGIEPVNALRTGHLNLDTFSPVNENGSFEFDRVLKRGMVDLLGKALSKQFLIHDSQAFKSSWKPAYLVLRPNLLSVYKDEEEASLRVSITLSDVTAVAEVKAPRSNREHVFGIFSPEKNYKFQALSGQDANEWIGRIRAEIRIDEEDEALFAQSRKLSCAKNKPAHVAANSISDVEPEARSSSPELTRSLSGPGVKQMPNSQEYSGNEITEYSDFSDAPAHSTHQRSTTSLPKMDGHGRPLSISSPIDNRPADLGVIGDLERVVCQGFLQCLQSKRGVRQWKKLWIVLRPKSLGLYKDEKEYSAVKIIPMSQVINAAEIDPISRSKNFCLQIIAEERSYRFCAPDEEALARWLGALKSVVVTRKKAIEKAAAER